MRRVDWNEVQEASGYDNPAPGAYIAVLCGVEDHEDKEYLKILWDFSDGEYKGSNRDTYDRAGFWPIALIRSYKPKALGFFKAFKTALEESNPGYMFDESNLNGMVGKKICVVLGEEEYQSNDGSIKTRLHVSQTRSLEAYRKGDFKVPALKPLSSRAASSPSWTASPPAPSGSWGPVDDDGELPF